MALVKKQETEVTWYILWRTINGLHRCWGRDRCGQSEDVIDVIHKLSVIY